MAQPLPQDGWIHIPNWDEYQHYKDRDAPWIKDYRAQLDNPDYLGLSFAQRGLLRDLRILYASTHRRVSSHRNLLSKRLQGKVQQNSLEALNHAGFIVVSASKTLALEEKRREERDRASKNDENSVDPNALKRLQELRETLGWPLP